MSTLHIRLLGGFALERAGSPLPATFSERAQVLLVYLLLHHDTPQPRQHIAFRLWPDSMESQARTNLRSLLHQLRQHLPRADEMIESSQQTLQWRADAPVVVDLFDFQAALALAAQAERRGDAAAALAALEGAVALYRGELLPGSYEEWVEPQREALRLAFAGALGRLLARLEQAGEVAAATHYAERLVQHDPLDESATVTLMRLRAHQGDRAGVRRAYEKLEVALRRELEVEPAPTTRAACARWLTSETPAPTTIVDTPPAAPRLPPPRTTLVGREEEVETLSRLLLSPSHRLVTLSGMGGMGKTRLALELAHLNAAYFADGAVWVRLQPVQAAHLLTTALAEALGLRFHGGASHEAQLQQYLRERHLLLVLDNFEHLLDGVGWLAELLANAPRLTLLATSRVRLNLQEEWVWEMEGLSLPTDASLAALEESCAARLFRQAAQQGQRAFEWGPAEEQAAIARLCHLLDGMPLALELAAAWGRLLSPSEILQELEQNLDFLRSTQWNLPERHRSLRAVFDHSWALLPPGEQRLLRRLSIFRGPFPREAAVQVAGATLPLLSRLLDSSLLRRMADGRFMLHEAIRQYAAAQLAAEPAEEGETRDRHLRYFAGWMEAREWPIKSARQQETMEAVARQMNDVRMAWGYAAQHAHVTALAQMFGCLKWYYEIGGYFGEAFTMFERAVEGLRAAGAPEALETAAQRGEYALLVDRYGWFAARLGHLEQGLELIQQALALAEALDDPRALFYGHVNLAFLFLSTGRTVEAAHHARRALDSAPRSTGEWGAAIALAILGWLAHLSSDEATAQAQLEESLRLWRRVGDPRGLAFALNFMSGVAEARAADDEVIPLLHETVSLSAQMGDRWAQASTLTMLGRLLLRQGELEQALASFQQSRSLFQQIGEPAGQARALVHQSRAQRRMEGHSAAQLAALQALRLGRMAGNRGVQLEALAELGGARAAAGAREEALTLLLVALPDAVGSMEPAAHASYSAMRDRLMAELSPAERAGLQHRVAAQSVEGLVAEQLRE